ncbi:hypothetical protein C5167_039527 [Papaver somniferum]|uniref:Uncharacterized protein n=1 Tax=Papaver somniferum TaxID=3469 RepID=A0A4Y7IFP0_PAPSO|nr:hypothetical protein C5167_039527 [Papaver somniferum]
MVEIMIIQRNETVLIQRVDSVPIQRVDSVLTLIQVMAVHHCIVNIKNHHPPRRSISKPTPPPPPAEVVPPIEVSTSPSSMATMIEQKFVHAVAYEPFVLTRCKSEPLRSSAKLLQKLVFGKV